MNRDAITGLVLAGGLGRRMGSTDKGLRCLNGQPMVAAVIARLLPQVGRLLINANQNFERYAAFGHPVVADDIPGFAGPLAGLHAGLRRAETEFILTAPCDSPLLPADLAQRLGGALEAAGAELAVARTGAQPHPVFALTRRRVLPGLQAYLATGGRRIDRWYADLTVVEVAFDDEADAFLNINTTEELLRFGDKELP